MPKRQHNIALHISTYEQLLHSKDTKQKHLSDRLLDPDFSQFLLEESQESDLSGHLKVNLYLDQVSEVNTKIQNNLIMIIRRFFLEEAIQQKRKLFQLLKVGFSGLIVGIIVNILCLIASYYLDVFLNRDEKNENSSDNGDDGLGFEFILVQLLTNILSVIGWAFLWTPLDIVIYDWWPILVDMTHFRNLSYYTTIKISKYDENVSQQGSNNNDDSFDYDTNTSDDEDDSRKNVTASRMTLSSPLPLWNQISFASYSANARSSRAATTTTNRRKGRRSKLAAVADNTSGGNFDNITNADANANNRDGISKSVGNEYNLPANNNITDRISIYDDVDAELEDFIKLGITPTRPSKINIFNNNNKRENITNKLRQDKKLDLDEYVKEEQNAEENANLHERDADNELSDIDNSIVNNDTTTTTTNNEFTPLAIDFNQRSTYGETHLPKHTVESNITTNTNNDEDELLLNELYNDNHFNNNNNSNSNSNSDYNKEFNTSSYFSTSNKKKRKFDIFKYDKLANKKRIIHLQVDRIIDLFKAEDPAPFYVRNLNYSTTNFIETQYKKLPPVSYDNDTINNKHKNNNRFNNNNNFNDDDDNTTSCLTSCLSFLTCCFSFDKPSKKKGKKDDTFLRVTLLQKRTSYLKEQIEEAIESSIQNYFNRKRDKVTKKLQRYFSYALKCLIIGTIFFIAMMIASLYLSIDQTSWLALIGQTVSVGAWVVLWRPVDLLLFYWWDLYYERTDYSHLRRLIVSVDFLHTYNQP